MTDTDIARAAFDRAWSVYVLMNKSIDEHDERRDSLERFIRQRWQAGNHDSEVLAVEGLKFLKENEGRDDASFI